MRLDDTERRLQEASEILQVQIAERKRAAETFEKAQEYTESIVETIREPLIVLTPDPKVISANCSFFDRFHVTAEETEGRFVYSIGDHSLDIPVFFPAFFLLRGNEFFDKLLQAQKIK
jgi:PAS domain-containing protein